MNGWPEMTSTLDDGLRTEIPFRVTVFLDAVESSLPHL